MSIRIGSAVHRDLFCRSFVATHQPFEPHELPWPELDARYVEMLRSFPFWAFAMSMEGEADRMITTYAKTVADPVIRQAVDLQAYEEGRHGRLLGYMLQRYGIEIQPLPRAEGPVTRDDFVTFGFGECSDSFIGFGGFAIAREKRFFPAPLLDIFEHILYEEARHIVFFINWWRYEEALAGTNPFVRFGNALRYHVAAISHTAQGAAAGGPVKVDLTSGTSQEILAGVTPQIFLERALGEHKRMMERFDHRLLRPRIVPTLATAALLGLRMLPPREPAAPVARLIA